MTEAQHTPGPWDVDRLHSKFERTIVAKGGEEIASVNASDGRDEPTPYPVDANARLIAAAPDLLDACRELAEQLSLLAKNPVDNPWVQQGRKAIAKATGV